MLVQEGSRGATTTSLLLPTLRPLRLVFQTKQVSAFRGGKNGSKSPQEISCSAPNEQRDTTSDVLLIIAQRFASGEADIVISAVLGSQTAQNIGQTFIRCRETVFRMNGNAALWLPSGEISHTEPPRSQNKMRFSQKIEKENKIEILLHHVCLHEHTHKLRESRQRGTLAKHSQPISPIPDRRSYPSGIRTLSLCRLKIYWNVSQEAIMNQSYSL